MAKTETTHTVQSAANAAKVSTRWIRELLWANRLAGARMVGGKWVIPEAAVAELKREREKPAAPPVFGAEVEV